MNLWILALRPTLAAVLAVAGVAKLVNPDGIRDAAVAFGIPNLIAKRIDRALPVTELLVAAGLIVVPTAWLSSWVAGLLLTGFTVMIALNLALGRTAKCRCFGSLSSDRVGAFTLARTTVLALAAWMIVFFGRPGNGPCALGCLDGITETFVWPAMLAGGAVVMIAPLYWIALNLARDNARIFARLETLELAVDPGQRRNQDGLGLDEGTLAPDFQLEDSHGHSHALSSMSRPGIPMILIFSSVSCAPCRSMSADFQNWGDQSSPWDLIVLIARHSRLSGSHERSFEYEVDFEAIAEAYRVAGTPSAVALTPQRTVAHRMALGPDEIRHLVESIRESAGRTSLNALTESRGQASRPIHQSPPQGKPLKTLPLTVASVVATASCASTNDQPSYGRDQAVWAGTVAYQTDAIPIRVTLNRPSPGELSGSIQFADPGDGSYVAGGDVTGTATGQQMAWHTAEGVSFVGHLEDNSTFSGSDGPPTWVGRLEFPEIQNPKIPALVVDPLTLRRA